MRSSVPILASLATALALHFCFSKSVQAASFTPVGEMFDARYLHTSTLLPNGKVLVAGGRSYNPNTGILAEVPSAELYDPDARTWTQTMALITGRFGHTSTMLKNACVLVCGGYGRGGQVSSTELSSAELYDPVTGSWTARANLSNPRVNHTDTLLLNGKVLVSGGYNSAIGMLSSVELYDPGIDNWTATGALNTEREYHSANLMNDGKVLITGGYNRGGAYGSDISLSSAELYDPLTGKWTPTGPLITPRANHTQTLLPNGMVLVSGGSTNGLSDFTATAELYNPASGTWMPTGSMGRARFGHSATLLPNGQVLVVGGRAYDPNAGASVDTPTAELYEPIAGKWVNTESLTTTGRVEHTATPLMNGQVLITGGANRIFSLRTAELYEAGKQPILLTEARKLPNGVFEFSFTNSSGVSFSVWAMTNPAIRFGDWTRLGTATETTSGHYQFSDFQATNIPQRSYRVSCP